jgi:hypothetical protein
MMDFDLLNDGDMLSRVLEQTTSLSAGRIEEARRTAAVASEPTWTLPGLLGPTRVMTSFGHVPAQLVRVGDTLRTREGGFVRVQRISELRIDEGFLASRPDAAPVIIRRNGLRAGTPHQDVALSPAQLVSVGPNRFEDRLLRADALSRERSGIDRSLGMMVYISLHLAESAQINCDGLWVTTDAD